MLKAALSLQTERDVVDITGPQAAEYLQGQISTDVDALQIGSSAMSFVLDPKGRVESLFRLTRLAEEHFLADTESGFGDELKGSLERFKLNTKADFELSHRWMLSVRGGTDSAAAQSEQINATQGITVATLWPGADASLGLQPLAGFDQIATEPAGGSAGDPATTDGTNEQAFEWLRTLYGLPMLGKEIMPGAIPNETGLLDVAVNFTKGCYRGQELVERIDSRAGARRELYRVLSTEPLMAGEELANNQSDPQGKAIGEIVSVIQCPDEIWDSSSTAGQIGPISSAGFAVLATALVDELPADADLGYLVVPIVPGG